MSKTLKEYISISTYLQELVKFIENTEFKEILEFDSSILSLLLNKTIINISDDIVHYFEVLKGYQEASDEVKQIFKLENELKFANKNLSFIINFYNKRDEFKISNKIIKSINYFGSYKGYNNLIDEDIYKLKMVELALDNDNNFIIIPVNFPIYTRNTVKFKRDLLEFHDKLIGKGDERHFQNNMIKAVCKEFEVDNIIELISYHFILNPNMDESKRMREFWYMIYMSLMEKEIKDRFM